MSKIIGIDLGTTNSAVAVMEAGEPKILENAEGARTTPSIVALSKSGERLVGQLAKRQSVTNPKNTTFQIKRFIGHNFDEPLVQKDAQAVPFEVQKGSTGGIEVKLGDKWDRPEEISAMILQKLKTDAEARLGEKVTQAVITVPAYFNDSQRQATKDAGKIAGLEVLRIINEPTAAALAYGFNKEKVGEKIAVFDFGGGTFDVSILEVDVDEVGSDIKVKSTDGDAHLGGKDIDQKIINWLADDFAKEHGIDLRKDALAKQRLDEAAEKAKIELSTAIDTEINLPFITSGTDGPIHLVKKMTRADLESLTREYVDRAIEITKRAMEASGFKITDINEVILVGGQTRMPAIQAAVEKFFGKKPNMTVNPDEVVALGAALQGGILGGDVKGILLVDVIPLSLGIETMGNVATKLVEKNTAIPTSRSQVFSTAADNQTSVEINIVQGERALAKDNKSLGRFILDGIPPAPRGIPQVEVTFDVDANGILQVKAKDKTSGKEQSIRIEASSGLSKADIEKMQKEAELHAEDDKKLREEAEVKNTTEQLIYTAEKALKDNADKVPADLKASIEGEISKTKAARDVQPFNMESVKTASQALSTELQKIGEVLAKAQQDAAAAQNAAGNAGGAGAGPTGTADGANVKDAEVKEEPKA